MDSAEQNMIAAAHDPKQSGALDVAKHVTHAVFFGARHLRSDERRRVETLCELWLRHFRHVLHVPVHNKKIFIQVDMCARSAPLELEDIATPTMAFSTDAQSIVNVSTFSKSFY